MRLCSTAVSFMCRSDFLINAYYTVRHGLKIAPSSLKVSSIISKIMPAHLVQAYSKTPLNRVAWNLEMSAQHTRKHVYWVYGHGPNKCY